MCCKVKRICGVFSVQEETKGRIIRAETSKRSKVEI